MTYRIVKYLNDPVLERVAEPVTEFDTPELHRLVEDMFETMYASHGVGLAAPQIGVSRRVAVVDIGGGEDDDEEDKTGKRPPSERILLINPEVVLKDGRQTGEEGCLSIPGFREPVTRPKKTLVRAQDVKGQWFEIPGEELLARAMLHEIDHLHGIVFLNYLSVLKRDLIKRKIRKLQRAGEWE